MDAKGNYPGSTTGLPSRPEEGCGTWIPNISLAKMNNVDIALEVERLEIFMGQTEFLTNTV